ncbi:hypothetical protein [Melittangium boletus]|uniref:Uncharacterized protein n=1 Tax=Melittangium boletus DSM 14713 TaxID=1294270 RepID=A0A250IA82_9BACT|nr:hypothetical protein [Melittangium boletus]ATB28037.1 hypothetical protein MEBOL_001482 [Melittangium boletus DSM 14713]
MSDLLKGLGSALGGVTNLLSGGALLDMAGNALGLPPVITQAAKTVVGAMTGNVMLAANGAMGLAQELTRNPPAATEYCAPKDTSRACEGYAKPAPRPHDASCATSGHGHLDPKMNDYLHSLRTLEQNFQYLDATDGRLDGSLSRTDLQRISGDARVSPELRQSARFLVDNPGYFERLDSSASLGGPLGRVIQGLKNDDRISLGDVRGEILKVKADFAQYGQPGRTGGARSTPPASEGVPTSGAAAGSSVKGIINDPRMSLEEKINAILMNLTEKMDDEILQTMDSLAAAQDKKAGISNEKGNEKSLTESQRDIDRLSMRLQQLVEKRKTMFEMMSTMSMKFNEMAKTALSNMRGA